MQNYMYTWRIERVDGYPQRNGMENVAAVVYWELEARDPSDGSFHHYRTHTELGEPNPDSFIDYLELSPEEILPWVWSASGTSKEEWEQLVGNELYELLNPQERLQTLGMPWMADCCGEDGDNMDPSYIITPAVPPSDGD